MSQSADLESDPRFPSGKWVGFFVDKRLPGKHQMEIAIKFTAGKMTGVGRDRVGKFTFDGRYDITDGKCAWVKSYVKAHAVEYSGFNEGKGIWGTWKLNWQGLVYTGGFHIWPEGMADPTQPTISEEADVPVEEIAPEREPELQPIGKT